MPIFTTSKPVEKPAPEEMPVRRQETPRAEPPTPASHLEDSEDDWGAVPAFLRRSKLK